VTALARRPRSARTRAADRGASAIRNDRIVAVMLAMPI
jgi:hypothetical protein